MSNSLLSKKKQIGNLDLRPYSMFGVDLYISEILEKMSEIGFLVNPKILDSVAQEVDFNLNKASNKIFGLIGSELNLNSSKQVAKLIFEDLGLPSGKKKKTGLSTDEITLRRIRSLHPVIPLILEYRVLYKLKSTYLESLKKFISGDGRVHTTFLVDVASTGRVVSRDPNLQNIPIRGVWGNKIRCAFIPSSDKTLISVDYSQIDLRVLAHFSKEPKLIESFNSDQDIHLATAIEIFNKKPSEITSEDRRVAKTVNFGIIYGISPHGLSESLEIDQKQAAYFIQTYLEKYSLVKKYLLESKINALNNGYTETLGGIRRFFPELKSSNRFIRSAGERMAVNYPIQGSSAEIIKLAMVEIDKEFQQRKINSSNMLLQIHDELVFEVDCNERDEVVKIIREKMENVIKLIIPLKVTLKEGKNWGEMKEISN